jgi:hypothetical protein
MHHAATAAPASMNISNIRNARRSQQPLELTGAVLILDILLEKDIGMRTQA